MSGRPASNPAVYQKTIPAAMVTTMPSGIGRASQLSRRPAGPEDARAAESEARSRPGHRPRASRTPRPWLVEGSNGAFTLTSFWRGSRNGDGRPRATLYEGVDQHDRKTPEESQRHARGRQPGGVTAVGEQGDPAEERDDDGPGSAAGHEPGRREQQEHGVMVPQRRRDQLAGDDRDLQARNRGGEPPRGEERDNGYPGRGELHDRGHALRGAGLVRDRTRGEVVRRRQRPAEAAQQVHVSGPGPRARDEGRRRGH